MKLLLKSNTIKQADLEWAYGASLDSPKKILFITYALNDDDPSIVPFANALKEKFNVNLVPVASVNDPIASLNSGEYDGVFVTGGNTFQLLHRLQETGLLEAIKEKVEGGLPFMGVSAGSNVASPTIKTTNDMPIVWPKTPDAMGLVPFQINPHYPQTEGAIYYKIGDEYVAHLGETRAERIEEFHASPFNPHRGLPVVGLKEGSGLRVLGDRVELFGDMGAEKTATLFRQGQQPMEIHDGQLLSLLIKDGITPVLTR